MPRKPVGVDWDHTLVDSDGEWLPGAVVFLRRLRKRGYTPFVYSCRASWQGGHDQIQAKLAASGLKDVQVVGKPVAVAYLDDLNVPFVGDYTAAFDSIRDLTR